MEHTYTDSAGRRNRYADGGMYVSRRGEPEVFFSIMDDRDQEILRLAERERKLREALLALVLACDHNQGDYNKALADARDLTKEK